tara:strand:+ start:3671 stop:3916 length:246 start_codon:yes stop_codon:yes gene_type:complete
MMSLLYSVWQQGQETGTLDRTGESALVLSTNSCDTGGYNLATLRNVTLQEASVFVIDLWSAIALKWIGLTTTEKWFRSHDL